MEKYLEIQILKNIPGIGTAAINDWGIGYIKQFPEYKHFLAAVQNKTKCSDSIVYKAEEIAKEKQAQHQSCGEITIITPFDDLYPEQLSSLGKSKPVLLYAKGCPEILQSKSTAIIGSRNLSDKGTAVTRELARKIVNTYGRIIVSGLALGCDEIAHKTALHENGKTIAVLPSGLDKITPHKNKSLSDTIAEYNGCLVSEYDLGRQAERYTFVERDRITAALSKEILVVECTKNGGTMKTVEIAKKLNRKIGCWQCGKEGMACDGNDYIISSKIGMAIDSEESLSEFMTENYNSEGEQLSLFN